jgi:hypothetical protein
MMIAQAVSPTYAIIIYLLVITHIFLNPEKAVRERLDRSPREGSDRLPNST